MFIVLLNVCQQWHGLEEYPKMLPSRSWCVAHRSGIMYVSNSRFPSSFLIWSRQQVSIQVCWYYKFVISILVSLCCNGMQGWGDHKCFDPWWSMYIRLMCTLDVLVPSRYKKTTKMRCLHQDDLCLKELWAVPMWGHMYFMNDVFVQYQTHMSCETLWPHGMTRPYESSSVGVCPSNRFLGLSCVHTWDGWDFAAIYGQNWWSAPCLFN